MKVDRLIKKIVSMGETRDCGKVSELLPYLSHENGNVRRLTCSALGKIGDSSAERHLVGMLYDDKPQVRQYALNALGKLGTEYSLRAIKKVKEDESEKEYNRKSAKQAIRKITKEEVTNDDRGKAGFELDWVEMNEGFQAALRYIESGENIFITGRAGTGKSTLLRVFQAYTEQNIAVLAPTGVAAVNVQGQTIHSFFGFGPDITMRKVKKDYRKPKNPKLYKNLEIIVIDEISMVRADFLDCVEVFLRMNGPKPGKYFGGVQMVFIGDLYQLPPVVTSKEKRLFENVYPSPYFFDSDAFDTSKFRLIQLEKVYRQENDKFLQLLNAVRNKSLNQNQIDTLNKQVIQEKDSFSKRDLAVYLSTTNAKAQKVNRDKLEKLSGKKHVYDGVVVGDFRDKSLPARKRLEIKSGAQVMLVNNDRGGRWVNGTVGRVEKITKDSETEEGAIWVKIKNGKRVKVGRHTWETFRYVYNQNKEAIESESVGTFTQYPLILAWAITIHKSQGKTFERVTIDLGRGSFAHGQTYVALSRCVSLGGVSLARPLRAKDILMDWRVPQFMASYQHEIANEKQSVEKKMEMLEEAIGKKCKVEIVYLKNNDTKSKRTILPMEVAEMSYHEKKFLGVKGYCFLRNSERVFRVDRILEMQVL